MVVGSRRSVLGGRSLLRAPTAAPAAPRGGLPSRPEPGRAARSKLPPPPRGARPRRRPLHRQHGLPDQQQQQHLHEDGGGWSGGRLRRLRRPGLLRPHSTGSTASSSSFSSVSSTSTAATAASSSSSWSSSASPEPLLPLPAASRPLADLEPGAPPLVLAMAWRPVTRRAAKIARELYSAWSGRVGANAFIPSEKVQQLFNDMQLYPSKSDVLEMLRCAQQCAQRSTPNYLTFGEFCVFATELRRCVDKGISRPAQLSRLLDRDGEEKKRTRRKVSKGLSKPEVFLGGSCNPTTWRQDVAIPLLKNLGITYYNPQVSEWAPELIEKEHYAKQNAAILLFVIDNQTRNTASTVEVAFFSGLRRSVMLVVEPYPSSGCQIAGEAISDDELEDLTAGQQAMQVFAERQDIPVFPNVTLAVNGIAKVLWKNVSVHELHSSRSSPQISDRLMKLREAFDAVDLDRTGEISLKNVRLAFRILNNRNLPLSDLRTAGVLEKEAKENVPLENLRVNFDQFCAIVAEFKTNQERWNPSPVRSMKAVSPGFITNQQLSYDVYLGGSSENTSWRDDVAIPLLKNHGLKYIMPPSSQWTKQMLHSSVDLADRSRVLLFVITNTSRSLAELCMVAYCIGLGFDVVLYIELLTEQSVINGKELTKSAVKDYNRGRMYLRDLAVREGVPLFDSIPAAVEFAATKCLNSSTNH